MKRRLCQVFALLTLSAGWSTAQSLFVSSVDADLVVRFHPIGTPLGTFASGGGLDAPTGVTFGPDGNLYVSSLGTNQVLRFDGITGAFLGVFASGGGLDTPHDLVFGPDGNLYVASRGSNQVLRYHGVTGAFLGFFALAALPQSIAFGPDGSLYLAGDINPIGKYDGGTGAFIDIFCEWRRAITPVWDYLWSGRKSVCRE